MSKETRQQYKETKGAIEGLGISGFQKMLLKILLRIGIHYKNKNMKNWKTTLIGLALAGLSAIATFQNNGGDLKDWKLYLIPAVIAMLGYFTKDYDVTGGKKAQ
jgi:hypothetical protein